ncbi:Tetraspanin family-domain-containing protein [Zychaea mexicana]|uniref:Tetraspanin family-domain-containing protein n=1 Tax=Zychaea mexicana TaxID=64656 RepID=UPI0022FE1CB1|nr:Tetraspanin family-domain-containing protein [Zychaea mexicana]KAI9484842.1 Tetraspanin family-domain-containing protein [Zychaea mexicana]
MAPTCCARLSKWYMITTNLLFACLGIAYIAFGVIGNKDGFKGASLFPESIFKQVAILGAIVIFASILGMVGTFVKRKWILLIYMLIVVVALVYQVVIGIKIYQKGADSPGYVAPLWSQAKESYRASLQNDFSCCGFNNAMDQPAVTDTCNPQSGTISPDPPCYDTLTEYVDMAFMRFYVVLFAALAVEILALTNAITVMCTRSIYGAEEDEDERRRRRKSGIRLDDISPDTPTTAGSHNNYSADANNYYGAYKESNAYSQHDSYDAYNRQNTYQAQGRYY